MVVVTLWREKPPVHELAKVELPKAQVAQSEGAPVLPPAPEMRRAAPHPGAPVSIAGVRPVKPPAPPPSASPAPAPSAMAALNGAVNQALPSPRNQQQFQNQGAGNAFLDSLNTLRGVVTDPTGAAVPSARVEAKSPTTGDVTTFTDARGQFQIAQVPGTKYQVKASKEGFRAATTNVDTPAAGPPELLKLKMEIGAATETVQVTAAASELKAVQPIMASRDDIMSLHGVVTDTSGSVLTSVALDIKSVATGEVKHVSTDAEGAFNAPEPLGKYRITASKPGFQTRAEEVDSAEAVNLQMAAASTAAVAPPRTSGAMASGRALGGIAGGAVADKAKKDAFGAAPFQYELLRQMPNGDRVPVAANQTVPSGATLILRVTPTADGELRIDQANGSSIANAAAQNGKAIETTLPRFKSGRVDLRLTFSTQEKQPPAVVVVTFRIR